MHIPPEVNEYSKTKTTRHAAGAGALASAARQERRQDKTARNTAESGASAAQRDERGDYKCRRPLRRSQLHSSDHKGETHCRVRFASAVRDVRLHRGARHVAVNQAVQAAAGDPPQQQLAAENAQKLQRQR